MRKRISDEDAQWKEKLTPEQYHILREKGTEIPGTGALLHNNRSGDYTCAACGTVLFNSASKYESTMPGLIGWPSFSEVAGSDAVELIDDSSLGMHGDYPLTYCNIDLFGCAKSKRLADYENRRAMHTRRICPCKFNLHAIVSLASGTLPYYLQAPMRSCKIATRLGVLPGTSSQILSGGVSY